MSECPFCNYHGIILWQDSLAIAFEPLNPVTPGHVLMVSRSHVADATKSPYVTAGVMARVAVWAKELGPCNIITSVGEEATQTVFHFHVHIVPRKWGDGLHLPWTEA